jgi:hypothetical protein
LDLFPSDRINDEVFEFDEEGTRGSFAKRFENVGFETENYILNMGSLFWFINAWLACLLGSYLLKVCSTKHRYIMKVYIWLKTWVFWNFIIRLILESYIDLSISSFINILHMTWDTTGEIAGACMSCLSCALVISFPVFMFIFIT